MIIGIDIGTHSARAAALDARGQPRLIPLDGVSPHLPAVVRYTMHGAEVGAYPARFLVCNWENSVRGCTRYLARYADLPAATIAAAPFAVLADGDDVLLDLLYARVTPQAALSELIGAICRQAATALGAPIDEVVLTVPASAEDRYRVLMRQAAEAQGLRVHRLINQPSAALLALQRLQPARTGNIAVVDVGGGTTDVSIAALAGGAVRILSTAGDPFLGGHDLAARAAAGLAERMRAQAGRDLLAPGGSKIAGLGLLAAAEQALRDLSVAPQTTVAIDHGAGFGRDLYTTLRRSEAVGWLAPELERVAGLCARALAGAGLAAAAIDEVLLIGGGGDLPGVRAAIARAFARLPADLHTVEPLALAAYGAALAGSPACALQDVSPYPLGIRCYIDGELLLSPILAANTPIPTPPPGAPGAHTEGYYTRFPGQTSVALAVLQYRGPKRAATSGPERVFPAECELLGEWEFAGLNPPPGEQAPFSVTFSIDADGILHLLAEERATGHRLAGTVRRAS